MRTAEEKGEGMKPYTLIPTARRTISPATKDGKQLVAAFFPDIVIAIIDQAEQIVGKSLQLSILGHVESVCQVGPKHVCVVSLRSVGIAAQRNLVRHAASAQADRFGHDVVRENLNLCFISLPQTRPTTDWHRQPARQIGLRHSGSTTPICTRRADERLPTDSPQHERSFVG